METNKLNRGAAEKIPQSPPSTLTPALLRLDLFRANRHDYLIWKGALKRVVVKFAGELVQWL